ncbi:MAG: SCO1664 family protein [Actinomycetota bacterium]
MSGYEWTSSQLNVLEVLTGGDIEVLGRLPFSSNRVFLVRVMRGEYEVNAVYKPQKGERPLWDFPAGTLAAREVAAYIVAEAAGWLFVPPTVMRTDAPLGSGSLQLFIDHDPDQHYFVMMHKRRDEMKKFAAFDVVINNADRKAGHIFEGPEGRLWGVDHGLSFNVEPKLRTVIWAFGGELIPAAVRDALQQLQSALASGSDVADRLADLIAAEELLETRARLEFLLTDGRFPEPSGPFHMPWPLI